MISLEELERIIQKNERTIEGLTIQIETLNRQTDEFLAELNVTPEQLSLFLEKKEHFTEEDWNTLQQQKLSLAEKLNKELANIRNPSKTKKALAERNIPPHWLFVR